MYLHVFERLSDLVSCFSVLPCALRVVVLDKVTDLLLFFGKLMVVGGVGKDDIDSSSKFVTVGVFVKILCSRFYVIIEYFQLNLWIDF